MTIALSNFESQRRLSLGNVSYLDGGCSWVGMAVKVSCPA